MKKIYKLAVLAAVTSVLAFTSCNNGLVTTDAYYSEKDLSNVDNSTAKTINITATTDDGTIIFQTEKNNNYGINRSIVPEKITVDNTNYKFYLGTKKKKEAMTWEQIAFTKETTDATGCTGKITKILEAAPYEFTLYMVSDSDATTIGATPANEADIKPKAIFGGYTTADLRYETNVNFYLTSNNLTGQGILDLTLKTDWNIPSDYTVDAAIYDYNTGSLLYPAAGSTSITPTTLPGPLDKSGWNAGQTNGKIDSGSYNVVVTFTNNTSTKSFSYSEKITLLPNRRTTGTINIPEIIDRAPTQPADLIVGYSKPTSNDLEYYKAEFAWTDTTHNERQFMLQLMNVDNKANAETYIAAPKSNAEWEALATITKCEYTTFVNHIVGSRATGSQAPENQVKLSESPMYVEGSLNMNNNHVVLLLPLGHRYVARICASNNDYETEWTYLDLHSSTGKTIGCAKGDDIDPDGDGTANFKSTAATSQYTLKTATDIFPAGVETINQFKITYNLVGGVFTANTDFKNSGTAKPVPATTVYASQYTDTTTTPGTPSASTTAVAILTPNSKAEDSPNSITAENGEDNTYVKKADTLTAYASVTPETAKLELKDYNNYYWKKWKIDSTEGTDYPFTPAVATDDFGVSNVYTKYANLNLFATYVEKPAKKTVDAGVEVADITLYELERKYIKTVLYEGSNNLSFEIFNDVNNISAGLQSDGVTPGTSNENANYTLEEIPASKKVTIDSGKINKITLSISKADLKYKVESAPDVYKTFTYDTVRLGVTRVSSYGNNVIIDKAFENGTNDWTSEFVPSVLPGIYYITISATSNKFPLVTYNQTMTIEIAD